MARLAFDLSVLRVLLIEDDTFARELEETALRELGVARVNLAHDGDEALDALNRGLSCDLVISNWNMPDFDGFELIRAIRERWPGLSVLMLTNNEGVDQISAARKAGVDGCLIKPFSLNKLREAIQLVLISHLSGGKSVTPSPAVSAELSEVATSIRGVLDAPAVSAKKSPKKVQATIELADKLSGLLTGFVGSTDVAGPGQMEVMRLYTDSIHAVLSGRTDLLEHETQNLILDGLSFATDLVGNQG